MADTVIELGRDSENTCENSLTGIDAEYQTNNSLSFSPSQSESSGSSVNSNSDEIYNDKCTVMNTNGIFESFNEKQFKSKNDIWGGDEDPKKDKRIRPISYKVYHRQIEKRRRCKMNDMISEIAKLVPMCKNVTHRLDKLTVLELAVQHMRMVTCSVKGKAESPFKPSVLSEDELKYLLENCSSGFLLVLSSDRAQILYVSESVVKATNHAPTELVGRSLFDIIHSKDVATVTDMLAPLPTLPTVLSSNENKKTLSGFQNGMSGSKRSFYCRMRTSLPHVKDRSASNSSQTHVTLLCEGFLKSWEMSQASQCGVDNGLKLSTFTCFIGVAKAMESSLEDEMENIVQYSSKHSADAKYLSVDPKIFPISGHIPQDLIGTCEYTIVHKDDVKTLSDTYRLVLEKRHQEKVISDIYRLKLKHGGVLPMRTVAFSLFNPFTKELEFISHQNFVVGSLDMNCSDEEEPSIVSSTLQDLPISKLIEKVGSVHDDPDDGCDGKNFNGKGKNSLTMNLLKKSCIDMDIITNILKGNDDNSDNTKVSILGKKRPNRDSGCDISNGEDYSSENVISEEKMDWKGGKCKKVIKNEYDECIHYCSGCDSK